MKNMITGQLQGQGQGQENYSQESYRDIDMTNRITGELQGQGQDRYDPMRVIKKHRHDKYDHRRVTGTGTGQI